MIQLKLQNLINDLKMILLNEDLNDGSFDTKHSHIKIFYLTTSKRI